MLGIGFNSSLDLSLQEQRLTERSIHITNNSFVCIIVSFLFYCPASVLRIGELASRILRHLVCAQHGRVVNGVKVSYRRTDHESMKDLSLEANSERVTNQGEEG